MKLGLGVVFALSMSAGSVMAAAEVEGVWLSPPDNKGQTGHVVVRPCGAGFCGKLERAFDANGKPITTKNVGKMLIRDMKPAKNGTYKGKAWVPLFDKTFDATMSRKGNILTIKGCAGPVCKSQKWVKK